MLKLRDGIVELYKKVATSIPPDVEEALRKAFETEEPGPAKESLSRILENIKVARQSARPVCQDTGVPVFSIAAPKGLSHRELIDTVREATVIATSKVPLVPNAIDVVTGENTGDNTGIGFPVIYLEETPDDTLRIDLILKDSGCEQAGRTYRLPEQSLNAGMNLEGVRRCVIDAVEKRRWSGCLPYIIGIGIGATDDQVVVLAKRQFFRKVHDYSEYPAIADLEKTLLGEINALANGPAGSGKRTAALGVKIGINHRHTSSFSVHVSVSCWASRRARLIW
ncbi:MAG TPA: fumarate hydratase [Thermodesulfovibrionales bacterium]|nr:fumarate hydratase [Thermodesulfovibrionales bacterium]